jgi:hypothetical protein
MVTENVMREGVMRDRNQPPFHVFTHHVSPMKIEYA